MSLPAPRYSRTIARPDYGNLFASRRRQRAEPADRHRRRRRPARRGNPDLLPLVSDNFDISLEWYFAPSSFVSAGFFDKEVKNFVGVGQFQRNLFGLRDPSSGAAGDPFRHGAPGAARSRRSTSPT